MKTYRNLAIFFFVAMLILSALGFYKIYGMYEQKAALEKSAQALLDGQPMGGRAVERADTPSDRTVCLFSFTGSAIALGLAIICFSKYQARDR